MKKQFIAMLLPLALAGFMSCQQPAAHNEEGTGTDKAKENIELTKRAYALMSEGKMDSLGNYIDENVTDHNPDPMMKQKGLAGLKEMMAVYMASNPDMKMEIVDIMGEGDMVMLHAMVSGTNTGPMGPMPATNKAFKVDMFEKLKFSNGKMTERWGVFDNMAMMTQLGLMPPPGAPEAPKAPDGGAAH